MAAEGHGCGTFLAIAGAVGSLVLLAVGIAADSGGLVATMAILAVASIGAVVACVRAVKQRKPSYGVTITTAGMNVRAVISPDQAFTQAIIGALNQAISLR